MYTESRRQLVEELCKMISPRPRAESWNKPVTAATASAITLLMLVPIAAPILVPPWLSWGSQSLENHPRSKSGAAVGLGLLLPTTDVNYFKE